MTDSAGQTLNVRTYPLQLDLLCCVVDNYGDIGVVFRLARALRARAPWLDLRLIVDDLEAFSLLAPGIDPAGTIQKFRDWTILRWNPRSGSEEAVLKQAVTSLPPETVIECFACGRPDWFEELLFDPGNESVRTIIDLEYLSAEDWVEEVHRMRSLTRSPRVQKFMFMPGFTGKTGGLAMDPVFRDLLEKKRTGHREGGPASEGLGEDGSGKKCIGSEGSASDEVASKVSPSQGAGPEGAASEESASGFLPRNGRKAKLLVFCYERDFVPFVQEIEDWIQSRPDLAPPEHLLPSAPLEPSGSSRQSHPQEPAGSSRPTLHLLAAAGRSQGPLLEACKTVPHTFSVEPLGFMAQEHWDALFLDCDYLVVRGEESLSRAALSGIPFLWEAYPQESSHHLVKVRALLERMRPHFNQELFVQIESAFILFNGGTLEESGTAPDGSMPAPVPDAISGKGTLGRFLRVADKAESGYRSFADTLIHGPELADTLLTFLRDLQ